MGTYSLGSFLLSMRLTDAARVFFAFPCGCTSMCVSDVRVGPLPSCHCRQAAMETQLCGPTPLRPSHTPWWIQLSELRRRFLLLPTSGPLTKVLHQC